MIAIVGATSSIGKAVAHVAASHRENIALLGRNRLELTMLATDLELRYGIRTLVKEFDITALCTHANVVQELVVNAHDTLRGAIVCVGYLGDQRKAEVDVAEARTVIETNFTGIVSLLMPLATHLSQTRGGFLSVVSSVAGDRGRQSNYVYGAAKGALTVYLQGLRNRLQPSGVRVITIKPGFVDTRMTYGRPGVFLATSPEVVGRRVYAAFQRREDVVYVPWWWRPIMFVLRSIPERVFKRLRL